MSNVQNSYEYDLVVIGGGSGGMAAAKKAASYGKKVVLFDFVTPSSQGTKWGLGGTCVNVGCVPKKIMHYSALLGAGMEDARNLGWNVDVQEESKHAPSHNWGALVESVQNHVKMLNFRYRVGLRSANVTYINAKARISGPREVMYETKGGELIKISFDKVIVAVGGCPSIPSDVPGALEYAITSDDIFSMKKPPGTTLVVGASYIALECAGFLTELGFDTTVAVRSILLRGFDQQAAEKIGEIMTASGTRFIRSAVPKTIIKTLEGGLEVLLVDPQNGKEISKAVYDTVLYATGRSANTQNIGLENVNIKTRPDGKIPVTHEAADGDSSGSIFAVGDCTNVDVRFYDGRWANPELTPIAIRAGKLLATRMFGGGTELMDYTLCPTTVFTPTEYGACGLSEEEAIELFGKDDVETYLSEFTSLEIQASHRSAHPAPTQREDNTDSNSQTVPDDIEPTDLPPFCLSKLVCRKSEDERVVGFHFVGPEAGETTQGFALALRLGAKKSDFDSVVGIHPTNAESFCDLSITRSSGVSWVAGGGCGGGSCG
eukprot:535073_1